VAPVKNIHFALEAMRHLTSPVTLDIFGPIEDPSYWERCQSVISTLPKVINTRYRGSLDPSDAPSVLAQYDTMLLPTLGENFGHVIAESLSAGCPVVCSDRTPWTDVLENGGGLALALEPALWRSHLEALASATAAERTAAKEEALRTYSARWRGSDFANPLVMALNGPA